METPPHPQRRDCPAPGDVRTRPLVLYDGGCGLCRREIDHYRRLRGASAIDWLDIAADPASAAANGIAAEAAMARFHVRDHRGQWHLGAFAFVELWSRLPAYRWLAAALRHSGTVALLDRAYGRFAAWRLARRCRSGACRTPGRLPGRPASTPPTGRE